MVCRQWGQLLGVNSSAGLARLLPAEDRGQLGSARVGFSQTSGTQDRISQQGRGGAEEGHGI